MPVRLSRLREMLARPTGLYISSTTTSAGSDTTVVDTAILKYDENRLRNKWLLMTSGAASGESRRIASLSTSTITVTTAYSATTGSGSTYEILPFDPDLYRDALQRATRTVYPMLYLKITDESIIVDNLLANSSFEVSSQRTGAITAYADYDSTIKGATQVSDTAHGLTTGEIITISGTTNYNGTYIVVVISSGTFWIDTPFIADDGSSTWEEGDGSQEGRQSSWTATSGTWTFPAGLRAVHGNHIATATGAATLTQNIFDKVNVMRMTEQILRMRGFVFATVANIARLRWSFDGGATFAKSSDFHNGRTEWEGPDIQEVEVGIPENATTMTIYLDVASGGSGQFDKIYAWIETINLYRIPPEFVDGPHLIYQQEDAFRPNGPYEPLVHAVTGMTLRMVGMGYLTVPTGETGVVELSEQRAELLVATAAVDLYRILQSYDAGNRVDHLAAQRDWADEITRLERKSGIRMHALPSHSHDTWGFQEDSETRMLWLKDR